MVEGLEIFRTHFADCLDQYVLIGGAACDLLFEEAGLGFRATRDLDLVLTLETGSSHFGRRFWQFVKGGDYEAFVQSNGEMRFHRFLHPKTTGYPFMLELFSRNAIEGMANDQKITPVPLGDDISRLSAILLDEDYMGVLRQGRTIVSGVSLLSAPHLILFKAKAWLDLNTRKAVGERVDGNDIRKHRNDIYRLVSLLRDQDAVELPEAVGRDMRAFLQAMESDPPDRTALKTFGLGNSSPSDIVRILGKTYLQT